MRSKTRFWQNQFAKGAIEMAFFGDGGPKIDELMAGLYLPSEELELRCVDSIKGASNDENKRNSSCQSLVNLLLWLVIETDLLREAVLILYFVLYIFNHGVFFG